MKTRYISGMQCRTIFHHDLDNHRSFLSTNLFPLSLLDAEKKECSSTKIRLKCPLFRQERRSQSSTNGFWVRTVPFLDCGNCLISLKWKFNILFAKMYFFIIIRSSDLCTLWSINFHMPCMARNAFGRIGKVLSARLKQIANQRCKKEIRLHFLYRSRDELAKYANPRLFSGWSDI